MASFLTKRFQSIIAHFSLVCSFNCNEEWIRGGCHQSPALALLNTCEYCEFLALGSEHRARQLFPHQSALKLSQYAPPSFTAAFHVLFHPKLHRGVAVQAMKSKI